MRLVTAWGVIPSIRVRDMAEALAFYRGTLEFTLDGGGDDASNSSLTRGEARVMIETAADHYGDEYNAAIRERLGTPSCMALYMEASDLADRHSPMRKSRHSSPPRCVLIADRFLPRPSSLRVDSRGREVVG